jgi:hypothetical protein
MLKFVHIKNHRIPIPVPLANLEEALQWVSSTFAVDDKLITRALLDGQVIDLDQGNFEQIILKAESDLFVQVESPTEISVQSLEVIKDFCTVLTGRMKVTAVGLYEYEGREVTSNLSSMLEDMAYLTDLRIHVNEIIDAYHEDIAPFEAMALVCDRVMRDLNLHIQAKSWKQCASILLNRLDPFLKMLRQEVVLLQGKIDRGVHSSLVKAQYISR